MTKKGSMKKGKEIDKQIHVQALYMQKLEEEEVQVHVHM